MFISLKLLIVFDSLLVFILLLLFIYNVCTLLFRAPLHGFFAL